MNTGVEGEGNREPGKARLIDLADPGYGDDANKVQGHNHSATVSIIVIDAPPGADQNSTGILTRKSSSSSKAASLSRQEPRR